MKQLLTALFISAIFFSCSDKKETGEFSLEGNIKNVPDQQVYLEQIFFSDQAPQVLDTAEVKGGKFEVNGIAAEEGLYRLRFASLNSGFIFINDKPDLTLDADVKDSSLLGPKFNSPANKALQQFLQEIEGHRKNIMASSAAVESLQRQPGADSLLAVENQKFATYNNNFNQFITTFLDTTRQPVVAMFAAGYTRGVAPADLNRILPNLAKRFPKHQGVGGLVTRYNEMLAGQNQPKPATAGAAVGSAAPDFSMDDTEGKPFSLSQLKGKYVLVDFWASWCGPCRAENPNVVEAYKKFKDKNFTILGVSLDEDKEKWLKAIQSDNLTWKHVSDLKGWQNATVQLYGYEGIPYNVLLDPEGKIIATSLRDQALHTKLAEVLK